MTLIQRYSYGVTLGYSTAITSPTYTVLGAIVDDLDGGDAKADEIETTLLADKIKSHIPGQIDPNSVTFTIAYDPADTNTSQELATLLVSNPPTPALWQIKYPVIGGETQQVDTFEGYVVGLKRTIKRSQMITCDVTIRITNDNTNSIHKIGIGGQ